MSYSDFEQRLASDSAFASKISSAKTPEEIVQIAKAEGVDINISDISNLDELSLDQLAQVSGGMAAFKQSFGASAKKVDTNETTCIVPTTDTKDDNPACGGSFTMKLH